MSRRNYGQFAVSQSEYNRKLESLEKRGYSQSEISSILGSYSHLGTEKGQESMGRAQLMQARLSQRGHNIQLIQWGLPIIGYLLLIVLIIGPGFSAITQIIGGMTWWVWVLAIFIIIYMWRR